MLVTTLCGTTNNAQALSTAVLQYVLNNRNVECSKDIKKLVAWCYAVRRAPVVDSEE